MTKMSTIGITLLFCGLAFSFQKSLTHYNFVSSIGVLVQLLLWLSSAEMLFKDTIILDDEKYNLHHKVIGISMLWGFISAKSKLKIMLVGFG